jgi:hypothetical protein
MPVLAIAEGIVARRDIHQGGHIEALRALARPLAGCVMTGLRPALAGHLDLRRSLGFHGRITMHRPTVNAQVRTTSSGEVFTFGADLGERGLAGGPPTG